MGASATLRPLARLGAGPDKAAMTLVARHLLLAALLLRALMPLGWMPGAPALGQGAFIICMADGQIRHGTPARDESGRHPQPCAFAAASLLTTPQSPAIGAPFPAMASLETAMAATAMPKAGRFTPQSPRGPPAFA